MGHVPNQTVEPAQSAHPLPRLRVFVGVKIAPTIACQLAQFAAVLKRPFVRPVAPADIHLTLVAPWNVTSLPDTVAKLSGVVAGFAAFPLLFQHVSYGHSRNGRACSGLSARPVTKSRGCAARSSTRLDKRTIVHFCHM